jgi:hypothetical protein
MTNDSDSFFTDPIDPHHEARSLATEAVCQVLLWMGDARTLAERGLRTSVALYCLRPDLVEGVTLGELGDSMGLTRQRVHQLAASFRKTIGLTS